MQTKIINKTVTNKGGVLSIDAHNPYFEGIRKKVETKFGGEKNKGHIRCVAETICGSSAKLDEAVEASQVVVSHDEKGVAFYSIKTMHCGKLTSVNNIQRAGRGTAVSDDTFAKIANRLAAMGWAFKTSPKEVKAAEMGEGYPPICIEKMDSAKDAVKKLLSSCSQIQQKLTQGAQMPLVKQALSSLIEKMGGLQNKDATLDSMRLLGRWPNKRIATIDKVNEQATSETGGLL